MHPIIETNRTELKQLGDRYGALSVSAIGSMARGDASADSDVDLLIEPGPVLSLGLTLVRCLWMRKSCWVDELIL